MTCTECDTRSADVLPSRGDCQACLKARLDFLDKALRPEPETLEIPRFLRRWPD